MFLCTAGSTEHGKNKIQQNAAMVVYKHKKKLRKWEKGNWEQKAENKIRLVCEMYRNMVSKIEVNFSLSTSWRHKTNRNIDPHILTSEIKVD